MTGGTASVRARFVDFFALDDGWERRGHVSRGDWGVGLVMLVLALVAHELVRSVGAFEDVGQPLWAQRLVILLGALVLVPRRRWPLTVAVLAALHMFVTGLLMPVVMGQLTLQVIYFVATLSGVAWARSRREMLAVMSGVVVFMFAWIAWQFAWGNAVDSWLGEEYPDERTGLIGPVTASVVYSALVNVLYFGGAIVGGQVAWRAARQRARMAEQAATISRQSEDLRRRAVLEERLRIARELHDVVAHHVSVIGVQAAAGRRVLTRDPEAASSALTSVEESAREAVGQMRSLVGTLRDTGEAGVTEADRAPGPGLAGLPGLVASTRTPALDVGYDLVESPEGAAASLPSAVGLSVHRIAQEALTNVRRHSTADRVTVVVRVDRAVTPAYAEVEVTDNGRPLPGTSGSGLGLLGVRERAASRRGTVDVGPRAVGGFRVRVRFPLETSGGDG